MSVSKWGYYPEICDNEPCPGDCDFCSKATVESDWSVKVLKCNDCGDDIYDGELFYYLGSNCYCERCVDKSAMYADKDDEFYPAEFFNADIEKFTKEYEDAYLEGYEDGLREQHIEEIVKAANSVMLVGEPGACYPVKNTSRRQCYAALKRIQNILRGRN